MAELTLIIAFIAGLASFLSPCVLPLLPAFLGYLSGVSDPTLPGARRVVFLNSLAYVLGFSVVFAALGVLLNTLLVNISYDVQLWLSRIAGAIIILFGLYMLGLINISFLEREHKLHVKKGKNSYLTSFGFGAAFAIGWSPCVGAVLGSVLALAVSEPGSSFALLTAYSLGLGIPFLIVGLFASQALSWLKKRHALLKYFNIVVGVFLILVGILIFTQTLNLLANFSFVNQWVLE